ncbi:MAG: hypothetical protein R3D27_09635 [Hyphomicrobiaceae bacterium]
MDFIFKNPADLNLKTLAQGDIIARTNEVIERIRQAHQYYAEAPNYSHFVVLTQSCDLVRRRNDFKAPYITIAAVKPFKDTVQEYFDRESRAIEYSDFTYHPEAIISRAEQLLERHLNNTETEFFFLPKSGNPNLPEDLVVFLRLSIAMRKEHYDVLARAKIAELADVFQAKLGWLTGNIYSRVATPDIEERDVDASAIKARFYQQYIPKDKTILLSGQQSTLLKKKVKAKSREVGRALTREEVLRIVEQEIPEDVRIVAENIVEKLKKNKLVDADNEELLGKIVRVIANEPSFKSLVKSHSG